MITQEKLKEYFEYREGGLYWKISLDPKIKVGQRFGGVTEKGYRRGRIHQVKYLEHRLVFLFHTGSVPKMLDHVNRDRLDNRIENLREADYSQNAKNRGKVKNNTSGHPNVSWYKKHKLWRVQVNVNNKPKHFGYYEDFELACLVAEEAKDKYYGAFAPSLKGQQ